MFCSSLALAAQKIVFCGISDVFLTPLGDPLIVRHLCKNTGCRDCHLFRVPFYNRYTNFALFAVL